MRLYIAVSPESKPRRVNPANGVKMKWAAGPVVAEDDQTAEDVAAQILKHHPDRAWVELHDLGEPIGRYKRSAKKEEVA